MQEEILLRVRKGGGDMLHIIRSVRELPYSQWMEIYYESNQRSGREDYPECSQERQILNAEQDHYQYLREVFFATDGAFCAGWNIDGRYVAALRIEPYRDGYLLAALETAPAYRRRGYATALIKATLSYLESIGSFPVYAHVAKKNAPSLAAHRSCGFSVLSDYAVYIDGSVLRDSYTLRYLK